MDDDLLLICPECGKVFKSLLMYEWHIDHNSVERYLTTFQKVAENEIKQGRDANGKLQQVINDRISPIITQLANIRRGKPDDVPDARSEHELRKKIKLSPHDKNGKKK